MFRSAASESLVGLSQWPTECVICSVLIRLFFFIVSIFFVCHSTEIELDRQAIIHTDPHRTHLFPPLSHSFFFFSSSLFRTRRKEERADSMTGIRRKTELN